MESKVERLEQVIRALDRLISDEMPTISAEHPEDHDLEPWVAAEVVRIREIPSD